MMNPLVDFASGRLSVLCNWGMAIYDRQKCAIIRKMSAKVEILLKIRFVVPEF